MPLYDNPLLEEDITNQPSMLGVLDQLKMLRARDVTPGASPTPATQSQPAFIPQSPGQQAAGMIDDKTINQLAQMMLKEATGNKPIGPDIMEKITGQPGQGGFFGLGIQPTDVLATLFGALLTRNMPQQQAIQTTLEMATLPSKFRQQHRQNLQQMLATIANISHGQQQVAVGQANLANAQRRTQLEEAKFNEPTLARLKAGLASSGKLSEADLRVLLGLTAPSQSPEAAGAAETARRTAAEPFQIRAEERSMANRKTIIQLAAGITRQNPTAVEKNIGMVEKRIGRQLTEKELMQILLRDQGEDRIIALIRALSGLGGSGAVVGGAGNLSSEGAALLDEQRKLREQQR